MLFFLFSITVCTGTCCRGRSLSFFFQSVFRIRIRMDPHYGDLLDPEDADPDSVG